MANDAGLQNVAVDEYADFRDAAPPANVMDEVRAGVWLMIQQQAAVDAAEAALTALKARLNKTKYEELPTMMQKLGGLVELDLEMPNGKVFHIKREEKVSAKLSEGNAEKVFEWMKDHEFSHHINNNLVIPFTKGQEAELAKMEEYIKKYPDKAQYTCLSTIHPSTYTAFCNRLVKTHAGKYDPKVFGIHIVKQVTAEPKKSAV